MKLHTIIISVLLIVASGCGPEETGPPTLSGDPGQLGLTVDKSASVDEVQTGDEFRVEVTVHGFSQEVPTVVPFDAVLVIDKSGSLSSSDYSNAKQAAKTFVNHAENASAGIPGSINIGVVVFGEGASTINGLSSDYPAIRDNIDNLPDANDSETRIDAAMAAANNVLSSGSNAVRIAMLFSDGAPVPDENAQTAAISDIHIPYAQQNSFRYYTIGLGGAVNTALMRFIASATGGEYTNVSSSLELIVLYGNIFNEVAHTIYAGQIVLEEKVDLNVVEIIPGSFEVDVGLPSPSVGALDNFVTTGDITIPMGELPSGKLHAISFRVKSRECLSVTAPQEFTFIQPNKATASLSYVLGSIPTTLPLPTVEIKCWRSPFLQVRKTYDPMTSEVSIWLKSNYVATTSEDRTIRDIEIWEYPSIHFQCEPASVNPAADKFIPGAKTDLLYWEIPALDPQEERTLRFRVTQRAYMPRDGTPLRVDAVKGPEGVDARIRYTLPDGTTPGPRLPQEHVLAYFLDNVPGYRPDLGVIAAFDGGELGTLGLAPYDPVTAGNIPAGGPSANWPLSTNELQRWESRSIWVDSEEGNGFVTDWDRNNAAHVISRIDNVRTDALNPSIWKLIIGQGDMFYQNKVNRVYVNIYNSGKGPSDMLAGGVTLLAHNSTTGNWDALGSTDIDPVPPSETALKWIELVPNTLADAYLTPFGPAAWNTWTAELKIEIAVSADEKHTNNNAGTERVFVVK